MFENLQAFCDWLATTPASQTIQEVSWVIPTLQSVHIACIAIVMGSIALIDLRLLGVTGLSQSISDITKRQLPWVWVALVILFLTGAILIVGEPARSLENPAFQAKMLMLLCVIAVTYNLERPLRGDAAFWELSPARRSAAKALAVVSLLLWVGIVFAGRLIAYMEVG